MKFLFLPLLLTILFFSCKPKDVEYTIKGKLVNSCSSTPLANIKVQAIQNNTNDGFSETATSDANGDFEILFKTSQKTTYHLLNINKSNLDQDMPVESADYGMIPLYSDVNVYYKVKINNAYTTADTLLIVDVNAPNHYYKMCGPFHDTIIGTKTITVVNTLVYNRDRKQIEKTNTSAEVTVWYKINGTNYYSNRATIQAATCGIKPDTLTLIVK